jgi:phenylpropionate dioxygenase-like ring-hydroxylating dioxygenase large terminal subunit
MNDITRAKDIWQDNDLNLDGSRVIDRIVYVDPDVYAAEQERIFAKTWQWVAHDTELAEIGDYITVTIAGRPIIVSRDVDGELKAFFNTCTHRGAVLAVKAKGNNGGSFTCLYHAWCFDNAGKLLSAPLDEAYGDNLKKACYDIPRVRLETLAGNIFVSLDDKIEPLAQFLGKSGEYLAQLTGEHEVLGRVRWMLEGNWKLWHENFRDNYHPMYAHMAIGSNYQGVKIEGTNHDLGQGHSLLQFPLQGDPSKIVPVIRRLTGKVPEAAVMPSRVAPKPDAQNMIMAFFPNLDFQHGPAGIGHWLLQTVRPISLDRAIVEIVVFGLKSDTPEVRQERLQTALDFQASSGKISGDDTEAARRCGLGFGTYPHVRWSNMDRGQAPGAEGHKNDEYSLRAFYAAYKRYMGDALKAPARAS